MSNECDLNCKVVVEQFQKMRDLIGNRIASTWVLERGRDETSPGFVELRYVNY